MKLVNLICPGCRHPYETTVGRDEHVVPCPECGQKNNVPSDAKRITGICPAPCGKALDDHIWRGSTVVHCP
jgi:hypothetical protein